MKQSLSYWNIVEEWNFRAIWGVIKCLNDALIHTEIFVQYAIVNIWNSSLFSPCVSHQLYQCFGVFSPRIVLWRSHWIMLKARLSAIENQLVIMSVCWRVQKLCCVLEQWGNFSMTSFCTTQALLGRKSHTQRVERSFESGLYGKVTGSHFQR